MDTQVLSPQIGFVSSRIPVHTVGPRAFLDVSNEIERRVTESGIQSGLVVVSTLHTTAALMVNEHEPELLKDLDDFLAQLAPEEAQYGHNDVPCLPGERPNGHSHCQALLLHASVTIPIIEGSMGLGRYQRVFLVELDCARPREVMITLLGS